MSEENYVNLENIIIEQKALDSIPVEICCGYGIIPIGFRKNGYALAIIVRDDIDENMLDSNITSLKSILNKEIQVAGCSSNEEIEMATKRNYDELRYMDSAIYIFEDESTDYVETLKNFIEPLNLPPSDVSEYENMSQEEAKRICENINKNNEKNKKELIKKYGVDNVTDYVNLEKVSVNSKLLDLILEEREFCDGYGIMPVGLIEDNSEEGILEIVIAQEFDKADLANSIDIVKKLAKKKIRIIGCAPIEEVDLAFKKNYPEFPFIKNVIYQKNGKVDYLKTALKLREFLNFSIKLEELSQEETKKICENINEDMGFIIRYIEEEFNK